MSASTDHAVPSTASLTASRSYVAGSPERDTLDEAMTRIRAENLDVPSVIGSREVRTGRVVSVDVPHDHADRLGQVHHAAPEHVTDAIAAATEASRSWGKLSSEDRAAPFLRAADLLEHGQWRERLVAATMLELSKTSDQADGDAACETVDLLRANVANMRAMYEVQPSSPPGATNHVEYRPLEGFVFAISPFNFTAMSNLAFGPALLGNTVVWKPAESASLVAHLSLQLLREAGLPDGVINIVHGDGAQLGAVALAHRDLAAVNFTGSTATFNHIQRTVGTNAGHYRGYPRVVGETGGKDFVRAHSSADVDALVFACLRGADE
jgi:1-pyrroline-5-carboxylate dehydrogenase